MRRLVSFNCEGATLAGAVDEAAGGHGLLIVAGGGDTRWGAHRLFARLAAELAARGHPVFRFDRRGVGDSEGADAGFEASGPDIAAACDAFRALCPQLARISGFGLCDGATALALHDAALDGLILANPWLVPPQADLPPRAAIRHRYARVLTSRDGWRRVLGGAIDYRKAARGAWSLVRGREDRGLAHRVVRALARRRVRIILATGDGTAQAAAPHLAGHAIVRIDSASHSFAGEDAFAALVEAVAQALGD